MRRLLLIYVLGLIVTFGSIAWAQESNPSGKAELTGDTVEYSVDGNRVIAKGNVEIKFQETTLLCDQVEFFRDSQVANAQGHVRLITQQGEISGEKIVFNFEKMTGEFNNAKIFTNPYYGYGRKINRLSSNEVVMTNASLTTCDLEKPHYRFAPKRVSVIAGKRIIARGTKFMIGNVPLMYIPKFTQRLDQKKPLITFTPAFTKEWGLTLLSQMNLYLNEYVQGAIHLDLREKRGLASGFDVNYKTPGMGTGSIKTYYMNERKIQTKRFYQTGDQYPKPIYRERYKVEWRHKWDIDEKTNAIMQFTKLSDSDLLKDYFKREYDRDGSPQSFFLLTRQINPGIVSFRVDKRVNRFEGKVERLPEIRYDLSSQKLGTTKFYFKNISTYSNLSQKEASPSELRLETQRFDSDNELAYQTKLGIIEFRPYVGERATYYSKTKSREDYNVTRGIFKTGASLSTKFYKIMELDTELFGVPIKRLRHVITPTIDYKYVHDPSIASSKLDYFDSIDIQERDHTVTFGVENKLQTKRDDKVVDLARMLLSTDFLLKEDPGGGGFNAINSDIDIKPFDWLSFMFDSSYDTRREQLSTANFDIFVNGPNDKWTFGLGKRYNVEVDDQITGQVAYKINPLWKVKFYDRFDTDSGEQKEMDLTITRDLHCWEADLNFNETRGQGSEILMIFRLKAFPEMTIDAGSSFNKRKAGSQSSEGI